MFIMIISSIFYFLSLLAFIFSFSSSSFFSGVFVAIILLPHFLPPLACFLGYPLGYGKMSSEETLGIMGLEVDVDGMWEISTEREDIGCWGEIIVFD